MARSSLSCSKSCFHWIHHLFIERKRCGHTYSYDFVLILRTSLQINPNPITLDLPPLKESILEFTHHLTHELVTSNERTYKSLCYRPISQIDNTTISGQCFTSTSAVTPRSTLFSMSFRADTRDEFVRSIMHKTTFGVAEDLGGVRYYVESREIESIGDMKSAKWVAYAARALVMRFWDLLKVGIL